MRGLTSLFGMGRGEHPRQYHHKIFTELCCVNIETYWKNNLLLKDLNKVKAYVQLVLLGFDVTTFTPVAYQRHRL